jgi:hypothetical protein
MVSTTNLHLTELKFLKVGIVDHSIRGYIMQANAGVNKNSGDYWPDGVAAGAEMMALMGTDSR